MKAFFTPIRLFLSLTIGGLMIDSAIAGCTPPASTTSPTAESTAEPTTEPTTEPSPTLPDRPGFQQWAPLSKGESVYGLTFSEDGQLLAGDTILMSEIPVSYVSDGTVTYAQSLIVSEPSPSGRYHMIEACEGVPGESGLCWSVFLIDRQVETATKIAVGKYGSDEWMQWTADERYAVLSSTSEGVTWFVVLDPVAQETRMFEHTAAAADLSSFKWISDRTFEVTIPCNDRPNCPESTFQGNISTLFDQ